MPRKTFRRKREIVPLPQHVTLSKIHPKTVLLRGRETERFLVVRKGGNLILIRENRLGSKKSRRSHIRRIK